MQATAHTELQDISQETPLSNDPITGNEVSSLARDDFDRNVWCVLGLPVDVSTVDGVIGDLEVSIRDKQRLSFVTPNVNWLVRAWNDENARREVLDADLSLIDGAPLLAIARALGAPAPSRVAGSDLFEAMRRRPAYGGRKMKVYFFGGRDGAAEGAAQAINGETGPLEAVGWCNPGFGDVEAMSAQEYIDDINAADPDFVLVSLGAAKGQAWIDHNKTRLNAPVTAHLGAVVDFTSGDIARAPEWMRRVGLEWAWRIKEEPSLWRRYYKDGVALAGLVLSRLTPQIASAKPIMANADGDATFLPAAGHGHVKLNGALGHRNLGAVRTAFRKAVAQGVDVTLDFSKLEAFDRAFLGMVLMLEKALNRQGRRLFINGVDKAQQKLLRANCMRYSQSSVNTQKAPLHAARGEYGGGVA